MLLGYGEVRQLLAERKGPGKSCEKKVPDSEHGYNTVMRVTSILALVMVSAAAAAQERAEVRRPNVLLISIDDLNDWVGVLGGHPQAKTPNIDRLAGRGTLFTNAHCQAPVCAPSRASLATGRLPSSTGMYFLVPALAAEPSLRDAVTLVQRFAQEGYETLGVGKIHHGNEKPFFQTYGGGMGGFGPRPERKISYGVGHPLWDWGAYPKTDAEMPDARVADWAVARLRESGRARARKTTRRSHQDRRRRTPRVGDGRTVVPRRGVRAAALRLAA